MEVAERDQRTNLKLRRSFAGRTVAQHGRVLALNHEYGLFDRDLAHTIGEDRERVEPEPLQVFESTRMNRPRILIDREIKPFTVNNERFFQFGEQNIPADG